MLKGHGGNIREAAKTANIAPEKILDFSASINRWVDGGLFEKWSREAVAEVGNYPDPEYFELREAVGKCAGVAPESVLVGNGSTELLYLVPRSMKFKKGLVVSPSYADYADALEMADCAVTHFFLNESDDFALDEKKIDRAVSDGACDVVVLGNPNNPTGAAFPKEKLLGVVNSNPKTTFLVDESFADFNPASSLFPDVPENVVVIRSLTKYFGIPGIRAGYAVAGPGIVSAVSQKREPWTMNCFAQFFSTRLLNGEMGSVNILARTHAERDFLTKGLLGINGLRPFPSNANFLLVAVGVAGMNSEKLRWILLNEYGILIRDCSNFKGLDDRFIRIGVRTRYENALLLTALRKILG